MLKKSRKSNSHFDLYRMNIFAKSKCSQVWVETVVYTLIGLTIMGIVLGIATPAISRYKDEIIIEQTINVLNELNNKILEVRGTVGNLRIVEFRIKKGSLVIDSLEDKISYILDESKLEYSEPGQEIKQGDIKIITEKKGKEYSTTLFLEYGDKSINIGYNKGEEKKTFNKASTPYKLSIENEDYSDDTTSIDIKEIS